MCEAQIRDLKRKSGKEDDLKKEVKELKRQVKKLKAQTTGDAELDKALEVKLRHFCAK